MKPPDTLDAGAPGAGPAGADSGAAHLALLQEATAALSEAATPAEVAQVVIGETLKALEASAGLFAVLDGSELEVLRETGFDPQLVEDFRRFSVQTRLPLSDAVRLMRPILLGSPEDMAEYPALRPRLPSREGHQAWIAVPLLAKDRPLGALAVAFREPRAFTGPEVRLMRSLAAQAAVAFERATLLESERRSRADAEEARARLTLLARTGELLGSALDQAATLEEVARLAVPGFADLCSVYVAGSDGRIRRVRRVAADPRISELLDHVSVFSGDEVSGDHPVAAVVAGAPPLLVPDVTDAELQQVSRDPEDLSALRALRQRSLIMVPLSARGRILGALVFVRYVGRRPYETSDLRLAEDLGRRAGLAVDNARLYETVQEADRRKDEFLAMLGHELRNPLGAVMNAVELLQGPALEDGGRERAVSVIARQGRNMVRLVDDLLDVSRITRGKVELRRQRLDLREVAVHAVEQVRRQLEGRGQHLSVDLGEAPAPVHGDPSRLEQVLANLLGNASRYTRDGGHVRLGIRREGERIRAQVSDDGQGIEPELLPRIFDLFVQSRRGPDRAEGGLGLGLTLVKNLVELHGGQVRARSEGAGRGATFEVELPVAEAARAAHLPQEAARAARPPHAAAGAASEQKEAAHLPPAAASAASEQKEAAHPPHAAASAAAGPAADEGDLDVLIVDDNVDLASMLALVIERMGGRPRTAHDGPSALSAATAAPPDLVLLDLGLPGLDGFEVARRLRADPRTTDSMVVAMSGYGQPEHLRRSAEAGVDRHVVKPMPRALLAGLLEDLRRRRTSDGP